MFSERNQLKTKSTMAKIGNYQRHGHFVVEYGMIQLGSAEPHFSISGKYYQGGHVVLRPMPDEIAKQFPELKPLLPWNLINQSGVPSDYKANALHCFDHKEGNCLMSRYIKWGVLPEDQAYDKARQELNKALSPEAIEMNRKLFFYPFSSFTGLHGRSMMEAWLYHRQVRLRQEFPKVLARFNLQMIRDQEGLCPVCGDHVSLTGYTNDSRLIATCGDAFVTEKWDNNETNCP